MPNGMSEEAQSRGHAVWEGAPCKGALYPISGTGFASLKKGNNEKPETQEAIPSGPAVIRLPRKHSYGIEQVNNLSTKVEGFIVTAP